MKHATCHTCDMSRFHPHPPLTIDMLHCKRADFFEWASTCLSVVGASATGRETEPAKPLVAGDGALDVLVLPLCPCHALLLVCHMHAKVETCLFRDLFRDLSVSASDELTTEDVDGDGERVRFRAGFTTGDDCCPSTSSSTCQGQRKCLSWNEEKEEKEENV